MHLGDCKDPIRWNHAVSQDPKVFSGNVDHGGADAPCEGTSVQNAIHRRSNMGIQMEDVGAGRSTRQVGAGTREGGACGLHQSPGHRVAAEPDADPSGAGGEKGGYAGGGLKNQGNAAGPKLLHDPAGAGRDAPDEPRHIAHLVDQDQDRLVLGPLFDLEYPLNSGRVEGGGPKAVKASGGQHHYAARTDEFGSRPDRFPGGRAVRIAKIANAMIRQILPALPILPRPLWPCSP